MIRPAARRPADSPDDDLRSGGGFFFRPGETDRPPGDMMAAMAENLFPVLDETLSNELGEVRAQVENTLAEAHPLIRDGLKDLVRGGGKLLRPLLVLLGCRLGECDGNQSRALAAGVELLHLASLVHDDVIDEATVRRGMPTLNHLFDARRAVIAGDYILSRCFILAGPYYRSEDYEELSGVIRDLTDSEIAQDAEPGRFDIGEEEYLDRIRGKTAALFRYAALLGARAGGAERDAREAFGRFAENMGLAFQIDDDILDVTGRGGMGKPVGADLTAGIPTLPLILALREEPGARRKLESYRRRSALRSYLKLIRRTGARDASRRRADDFRERARADLESLDNDLIRREGRNILDILARRVRSPEEAS